METGLSAYTLQTLRNICAKYTGIITAVLYGSRAMGTYRTGSDIDIALFTNGAFTFDDLLHINCDFDESDMPYFVDVLMYADLKNPDLKSHIDRVGKQLYQA